MTLRLPSGIWSSAPNVTPRDVDAARPLLLRATYDGRTSVVDRAGREWWWTATHDHPCHCRTCAGDRMAHRLLAIAAVLLIVAAIALWIGSHGA